MGEWISNGWNEERKIEGRHVQADFAGKGKGVECPTAADLRETRARLFAAPSPPCLRTMIYGLR